MLGFSLKCAMVGHEDRVHHDGGRLYLECAECGRETRGWQLDEEDEPAQAPSVSGHAMTSKLRLNWRLQ